MTIFDSVGNKAKGFADNAKIGLKINSIERDIVEYKEELGEAMWKSYCGESLSPESTISSLCEKIKTAYDKIEELRRSKKSSSKTEKHTSECECFTCCECGSNVTCEANFCPHCGAKLCAVTVEPEQSKQCKGCGSELEDYQNFCPICGLKR